MNSRILHLADITAPRLGTSSREDEVLTSIIPSWLSADPFAFQPWAFESREFLRTLAVGKEISFVSTHSLPPNEDVPRDFGTAEIGGLDVVAEMLKNGWAKLKEIKREPTDEDLKKREYENEAKTAGKGLWNPHGQQVWRSCHPMRELPFTFIPGACRESLDANRFTVVRVRVEGKTTRW